MVPSCAGEVVVVAAFRREDLVRLHSLLACFQSPFQTSDEVASRLVDERSHEELRRYVALLLAGWE